MSKYVRYFTELSYKDIAQFGGKSCSLGELLQAGIQVPNGFAISAEAHKEFGNKPFSQEFEEEIQAAYRNLGLKRVAVRSSALAEDSSKASWAGQLETYLNVELNNIEDKIRKCWKSITTTHAVSYAIGKSFKQEDLLVGVAVQHMIESEVAGVIFTADPIEHNASNIIIEALFGLGEMLVQGLVTPDRFIVDHKSCEVIDFNIAIKDQQMVYKNGANVIRSVPDKIADKATLRETQVVDLARLGLKIEEHYKRPQDIEWALVDNNFYVVQSRPITTL